MTSHKLADIPIEILWQICLGIHSSDRNSLLSLSLVSRHMRSAVLPVLFKIITVTIRDGQHLEEKLKVLSTSTIQHVRAIVVQGWIPEDNEKPEDIKSICDKLTPKSTHWILTHFAPIDNHGLWYQFGGKIKSQDPTISAIQDEAWSPMAQLIRKCSVLTDLVWKSTDQIPPCVLDCIHNYHPTCKLHLNTFWLRSLDSCVDPNPKINAHELTIIQSPCLFSIVTIAEDFHQQGLDKHTYYAETLADITAHFVPRLRNLEILPDTGLTLPSQSSATLPRGPWIGLQVESKHKRTKYNNKSQQSSTSLQTLHLKSLNVLYLKNSVTSKLRHLSVMVTIEYEDLLYLTTQCHFDSLKGLMLSLRESRKSHHYSQSYEQYDAIVAHFFSSLPAIKELAVYGGIRAPVFNHILDNLGPRLRILCIFPSSSKDPYYGYGDAIHQRFSEACPHLIYLKFKVGADRFLCNLGICELRF
jgi:hypothetical protein